MMKTSFAAAGLGLVALTAAPVFAGGPVVPVAEPIVAAPVAVVPPAMFNGGYVGAGLGYAFQGDDEVGVDMPDAVGTLELSGARADLHTGYRWQRPGSNFVYGVEAMVTGGEISDDVSGTVGGVDYEAESELKWLATLRGSLGYTVRPDTLLYGFAGYSVGRSELTINSSDPSRGNIDESIDIDGYAVGVGLEKLLTDKWSVRGEYEYSNYGKESVESDTGAYETHFTPDAHTIRVGVNYRF